MVATGYQSQSFTTIFRQETSAITRQGMRVLQRNSDTAVTVLILECLEVELVRGALRVLII